MSDNFREFDAPELTKFMVEHGISEMVFEDNKAKMKLNEWIKTEVNKNV